MTPLSKPQADPRDEPLFKDTDHTARKAHYQCQQDCTKPNQPVFSEPDDDVLYDIEEECTYYRTRKRMDAAEEGGHDGFC